MVTLQISVSESTAKSIERKLKELKFAQPGEYIESLVRADELDLMTVDDFDPEHRKWINSQIQEALDDPREGFPITPEFFESWRKELEDKLAKGSTT